MRLLHLSVSDNERESILAALDERDLGYTVAAGAGPQSDRVHVDVAVPADGVEHVLDELVSEGYDRESFTASLDAEFATFPTQDRVQNRWSATPNRIAPTTLRSKAKELQQNSRSYLWMMALSAIVATAGLLIGSPAIVVGSMVIAPIVSPILTAAVGTVRDDRRMLFRSLRQQATGLGVAITTAGVAAFVSRYFLLVPEPLAIGHLDLVAIRLAPNTLAIVVGLAAGAAGAYGLATTGRVTILGVMIAAALIPTAAAAGIGIAWGDPLIAVGAALLLIVTVICVNIGAAVMLGYLGYRPDEADSSVFGWENAREAATVMGVLAIVIVVVATAGFGGVGQSGFEQEVNHATGSVLENDEYAGLMVEDISVMYNAPDQLGDDPVVTVTVARMETGSYPGLAADLESAIETETGEPVLVQVQFVEYQRSDS